MPSIDQLLRSDIASLEPYADQWAFLASIRRISRVRIEALVRVAESKGRIIGVRVAATEEDDVKTDPSDL